MMLLKHLKERIILQERTIQEADNGDVGEIWRAIHKVWADIKPLAFGDIVFGNGWGPETLTASVQRYLVRIRPTTHSFQRILWGEKILYLATQPIKEYMSHSLAFIAYEKEKKGD